MCEINKFFLCCELETGGKIIAWLNVILSLIKIVPLVLLYIAVPAVDSDKFTEKERASEN